MNSVAKTKIALLSVIAFLAVVYVVLLAVDSRSSVRTLRFDDAPEAIRIENGTSESGVVMLEKKNGAWLVSSPAAGNSYAADESLVANLVSSLKEIKLLGTVTGNPSSDADRYGLDENSRISVVVSAGGKELRKIAIGKNTSTSNQCYVQVDGKNTVYLEDSPLHSTFSCTVDSLRSKSVYKVDASSVMAVKVTSPDGKSFAVARNAAPVVGDSAESAAVWTLSENTSSVQGKLDDSKVTSWVNSLASLTVSSWNADGDRLPQNAPLTKAEVTCTGGTYTVYVSEVKDDSDQVQCSCSAVPYVFSVGKYVAQRYAKNLSDLIAK